MNTQMTTCSRCGLLWAKEELIRVTEIGTPTMLECPKCRGIIGIESLIPSIGIIPAIKSTKNEKKESLEWTLDFTEVKKCCNIPEVSIKITSECYLKVESIMKKMGRREWLAYLIGTVLTDEEKNTINYEIKQLYIPIQCITSASVNVDTEEKLPESCIGVLHSHHTMGSFFSQGDRDYINSNHNLSIVISEKDGMLAAIRYFPQCSDGKKYFVIEAEIEIILPEVDISNIQEYSYYRDKKTGKYQSSLFNKDGKEAPKADALTDEFGFYD